MYSEGSEYLPQNNETALQYFKKASDLVRLDSSIQCLCPGYLTALSLPLFGEEQISLLALRQCFPGFIHMFFLFRVIQWVRAAWAWPTCMEEVSRW